MPTGLDHLCEPVYYARYKRLVILLVLELLGEAPFREVLELKRGVVGIGDNSCSGCFASSSFLIGKSFLLSQRSSSIHA